MENSDILNTPRMPAVQGRFYPAGEDEIKASIEQMIAGRPYCPLTVQGIIGAVLPHAGHIFSGWQTVPLFLTLRQSHFQPETIIILHPNHSGRGSRIAIDPHCCWENSLGKVWLDHELGMSSGLSYDALPHRFEHSAEVIVPFIQYFSGEKLPRILPICMSDQSFGAAELTAKALLNALEKTGRKVLIIASSDFSHYEAPKTGFDKDQLLLDRIFSGDPEGLINTAHREHITACGTGPIATLLLAAGKLCGDYSVQTLARGHSGDIYPSESVVDYISLLVFSRMQEKLS